MTTPPTPASEEREQLARDQINTGPVTMLELAEAWKGRADDCGVMSRAYLALSIPLKMDVERALNTACETAHRYPYAVHSKPCSWPECELTCEGRKHQLSTGMAILAAGYRIPPKMDVERIAAWICWPEHMTTQERDRAWSLVNPGNKEHWYQKARALIAHLEEKK